MTHLIDPGLTEAKHGLARIPTIVAYHHIFSILTLPVSEFIAGMFSREDRQMSARSSLASARTHLTCLSAGPLLFLMHFSSLSDLLVQTQMPLGRGSTAYDEPLLSRERVHGCRTRVVE